VRWTRYAGWANIVTGLAVGAVMVGVGLGIIGILTGVALVASGVFMVWLGAGWDKPIEDPAELHKYGRPANAVVLAVDEVTLDGAGGRTAKVKFQVAPVNESDFISTRTVELPGGRVPSVGETVTVKFDPQNRKNLILLEEAYEVVDHTTAAHRMFTGSATLALVALLVLMLAAPAGAAVTKVAQAPLGSGMELAGQSVVYGSFGGGKTRVVRANPDGTQTVLKEFTALSGADDDECCQTFFTTGFAASESHVVASSFYEAYAKGALAQSDYRLFAGPVSAPPPELFLCQGNHPYDISGKWLAYLGDDCTEKSAGGPRVVTRDLSQPGNPVIASFPMTRQPNTLDIAGEHIALSGFFASPPELIVYSLEGAEQYKLNHNFAQFSLQQDGKVALAQSEQVVDAGEKCRIEWFSKAEPVPHPIDFCPRGPVRMVGDRIAFDRTEDDAVTLNITDLTGNRRAFAYFEPGRALGSYDFDGARLAYGVQGCIDADDAVWIDDLTGPVDQPTVEGGVCPAAILTKTARATSKGIVRLRVQCEEGCTGELNLRSGKSVVSRKPARFTIARGKSKTIPIKLGSLKDVRAKGSKVYSARVSVEQHGATPRTFKRAVRVLEPK
jgi:hypothetical protein